ncbi:TetR/AcrR family transcriptional regulator [Ectothiorhodospiraceae bacterium 2226]|nr:TetR/AcrR family transcriptional regulator [Ectothiorhodospiraceae bacterium 2226]
MDAKVKHVTAQSTGTPELVLTTALRLFTEHGYFNTSVHDIGRAAGVSIGSIYHHFKDKEGIAKALYDQLVARMGAALDAIEAEHTTTHDRCRAVVALLLDIATAEPQVMAYMLRAQHQEFISGGSPVCSSKPFAQMRAMVRTGMARGEVREMEPVVAASALFGGPLRMVSLHLDGLLERPLKDYLDPLWEAAWRAVAA